MQVTVLGGAGGMGRRAVKDIAEQKDVKQLIIGDMNFAVAHQLAGELNRKQGGKKVKAVYVDANIPETISSAISGSDVVASAIGPYFRYGHMVAEAAVEAGSSIVDICDDFDAVEDILSLNEKAVAKGVTVLTGMGWTPGLSNLLAVKAMQEMDEAKEVYIYWAGSPVGDSGLAVILHTLHIFTGEIPTFKDGKLTYIPAGSEREIIQFYDIGPCTMFHVGHPEPVTMGRFLPGLSKVVLKGGLTSDFLNYLTLVLCKTGLTGTQQGKTNVATVTKKILPLAEPMMKGVETRSAIKVVVKGKKDNRNVSVTYESNADMADLTGLPLAIGTLMIGRKQAGKPGVSPAEALIDCDEFIKEFVDRGVAVYKTG